MIPREKWRDPFPSLDVWLKVTEAEVHYVAHLLPTLDWKPEEGICVRLQLEPEKPDELLREYEKARKAARDTESAAPSGTPDGSQTEEQGGAEEGAEKSGPGVFALSPKNLMDFLKKHMSRLLEVRAYLLDPSKKTPPANGVARPQELPANAEPLGGNPFKDLIRIDEVPAHRGMSDYAGGWGEGDDAPQGENRQKQLLTGQLRTYYDRHLDPYKTPTPSDLQALKAIHDAQTVFDERLQDCFKGPLDELEGLGYPGVSNPRLTISTSLKPIEGLRHDSAVQYDVATSSSSGGAPYLLPEQCNGLGYQNLISMVFRLIGFRDDWMKVRKAADLDEEGLRKVSPPPLHLVLLEEPEAHLHVQVQQVFIRKAYSVLRDHPDLKDASLLSTQLVVSTHSSHVAHEVDFASMRYFRRHPARGTGDTPTSTVVNLSVVFGTEDETARFVSRYLHATHADLFFADGAILVEGAAERMLVPHFIKKDYKDLYGRYVTLLEIGGSHAHRLKRLIEQLGLNTLVITDIDAGEKPSGKKVRPVRGRGQITGNNVLKEWHPKEESLDKLLELSKSDKEKSDGDFSIRVAYQTPVRVVLKQKGRPSKALPRTFEDALVFENLDFFRIMEGNGLSKRFRDAIAMNKGISGLGNAFFKALNGGGKAQFALDVLYSKDFEKINPPSSPRSSKGP